MSFAIYKIYFGETLAYVGRTKQPINARLRGHFFKMPMHKPIDINSVTKIEIAYCKTISDMNLYEIYYIVKNKPILNKDDTTKDKLTIIIPELKFIELDNWNLINKWKSKINVSNVKNKENIWYE